MRYWSRDDTKEWVAQLEHRIEDLQFYLSRSIEWCEENEIYDERAVLMCSIVSLIWVSHLRNEPISIHEMFEILGISNWEDANDAVFEFNPEYASMELEDLLRIIVDSFL